MRERGKPKWKYYPRKNKKGKIGPAHFRGDFRGRGDFHGRGDFRGNFSGDFCQYLTQFFRGQHFQNKMEVLFPEKTSPRVQKSSAFWKYCSRRKHRREYKSQEHFGSTVPGKNVAILFWKY